MAGPTREFWEQRFAAGDTPWDRGEANPQLGAWLAAGALKPCRILVPGCGSGYEAAALAASYTLRISRAQAALALAANPLTGSSSAGGVFAASGALSAFARSPSARAEYPPT